MTQGIRSAATADAPKRATQKPLKKVAFVVSQFPETHETFILREFKGLEAAGLDFVIFSLKPCRDKVVQKDARAFLARTYYPFGSGVGEFSPGESLRSAAAAGLSIPWARRPIECAYVAWAAGRLSAMARKSGIGHVHAHWATAPASAALLMSKALGVPYSFTAHAWDIYAGDGCLAAKARGAQFIATCTRANAEHIRALLPRDDWDKVTVNYHGIPLEAVPLGRGRRSGAMRIAAAGRLVETKGFQYLVAALKDVGFPFQLTIVGDGPLRRALKKAAAAAGISDRTRFAGTVSNEEVFGVLSESDVFVMPSVIGRNGDRDGIPNVLLEAMAAGLPVIASRISGIPEAVIDGRTGILVPERDAGAISAALQGLWGSPEQAARLGQAAAEFVRANFCAQTNANRLFEVFRRHLGCIEE